MITRRVKHRYRSVRSRACDVRPSVRKAVFERDKYCIFCGSPRSLQAAHYISRGQGGLGIKENLTAVCMECHDKLDHSPNKLLMQEVQKEYLESLYPGFPDEKRVFHKCKLQEQ